MNKITWYCYDGAGRKLHETNGISGVLCFSYSAAGDLLSLTDCKGQTTCWQHDAYGRVTNKCDQLNATILKYTYDANGRLATRWSAQKGTTSYSYDAVGNLTSINYPTSTDVTLSYDPLNRLTNMVDAAGNTAFSWLAGGLLFTEDGPWASDTVTNGFTKRLRTSLGLAQPTGYWTNGYIYDLAQRLTNLTSRSGSFSYSYDASAVTASPRVRKLTLPNSACITNHFDSVGRLLFTRLLTSGGTITNKHEYSYNLGSQRTNHLRHDDSYVRFTYDNIGQLKSGMATNSSGSPLTSEHRGYAYDSAFNLCDRTNGTTPQTFVCNGKNEITNAAGTVCKYDANGNMTNNGNVYYGYDDENRLVEAWDTSGSELTWWWVVFVYDGQSRLRLAREYWYVPEGPEFGEGPEGSWELGSEKRYVYDGKLVIQERDANNTPTVTYTRGHDLSGSREGAGGIGGLLARSHGYSGGNWSTHNFYHADGNGNVTFLLANDQTLSARYNYDPYGRLVSSSGSLATANTYRFSSKEVHAKTGFSYYLYRWYAPEMQRWGSKDPYDDDGFQLVRGDEGVRGAIPRNKNFFVFVVNSPVVDFDPLGLAEFDGSCTERQEGQINASFERGCRKADENGCYTSCLMTRQTIGQLSTYCNSGGAGLTFSCAPSSDTRHCGQGLMTYCGMFDKGAGTIYLCPDVFQGACGDFACTIMHEMVHATSDLYDHRPGNPYSGVAYDFANCLGLGCPDSRKSGK